MSRWPTVRSFRGTRAAAVAMATACAAIGSCSKRPKVHHIDSGPVFDACQARGHYDFRGHDKLWFTSVAFSPDGRHVLAGAGGTDKVAILWDASTGERKQTFAGHKGGIWSVAFSPDGSRVLTGSSDNTAILWNAHNGQKGRTFRGHGQAICSVAFSPDGTQVLTGSEDKSAILWDAGTGRKLRSFTGHRKYVHSVAFSPDGSLILTGSTDETAILWEAATGRRIRVYTGGTSWVMSVAFSPDGGSVLGGTRNGTAVLWETSSGRVLKTFRGHGLKDVRSVAFSPDGRYVLTGSDDATAILWEVASGRQLRTFRGHRGMLYDVTFSPDGRYVLTGSHDGAARVWSLPRDYWMRAQSDEARGRKATEETTRPVQPSPRSRTPVVRKNAEGWIVMDENLERSHVYDLSTPEGAALSYVVAFNRGDAETMYNRLCSSSRRHNWDLKRRKLSPAGRMRQAIQPASLRGLMGGLRWEYTSCVRGPILKCRIGPVRQLSPSKAEVQIETLQKVPDYEALRAFRDQLNEYMRYFHGRGLSHSTDTLEQYLRPRSGSDEVVLWGHVMKHGKLPDRLPPRFEEEDKTTDRVEFILEAGEWKWDTGKL